MSSESNREYEKRISTAFERRGNATPRTGPWIVGWLYHDGPDFPNNMNREYNSFANEIGASTSSYNSFIRYIHLLKLLGIVEEVDPENNQIQDWNPETTTFSRQYYHLTSDADTDWITQQVPTGPFVFEDLMNEIPAPQRDPWTEAAKIEGWRSRLPAGGIDSSEPDDQSDVDDVVDRFDL